MISYSLRTSAHTSVNSAVKPLTLLLFFLFSSVHSQNHWKNKTGYVMEYGNVPAWTGIVDLVPEDKKPVYVFDDNVYHGHSNFVLRFLKRKVTFTAFKELVKTPATRQYIPFNLYDLRDKDFSWNGEKYKWAIKMCDYRLQDNPDEMLKLLSDTYTCVKNYLKLADSSCGKGIILLSNSEEATPNVSCLDGVRKLGLPVCSLKEFYSLIKYHPKINYVLNEGEVTGIIRFIKSGEENNAVNDETAIYVFEKTPERVPLAKGFITLQPQTYLSHINLLAINRKTPNVSTSDKELIKKIKTFNGKAVKLICDKKENNVDLEKTELTVIDFTTQKTNRKTELIAYDILSSALIDLSDSLKNTLPFVGAKAANYALLQKHFPDFVKKAYAIPFWYYNEIVSQKNIAEKVSVYCSLPDSANRQRLVLQKEIREQIKKSELPNSLLNAVKDLQNNKFASKKIRIRSSTNCEDLAEFNGAGLYLSRGIKPLDDLDEIKKKLLQVYAGLWNDNACSERRFFGIDHRKAGMAILINQAYEDEWANGVALTLPGDSGKTQLVIDAQPGDHEVTNPKGGDVPEELFFNDIDKNRPEITSRSNYGKVFIGVAYTKNLMDELRTLCKNVDALLKNKLTQEEKKNYGTDIEFKIVLLNGKAKLFIKQARLLNLGGVQ